MSEVKTVGMTPMVRCHCYEIWQILSELVGTGHQRKTSWWDANTAARIIRQLCAVLESHPQTLEGQYNEIIMCW
jgi:hypothetical protein